MTMAALEQVSFGAGDWLTDGVRLVQVLEILPDGDVVVDDAQKRADDRLPALDLMEWRHVKPEVTDGA